MSRIPMAARCQREQPRAATYVLRSGLRPRQAALEPGGGGKKAQEAPFLMQKLPVPRQGPREALGVGRSSDARGWSSHRVHPPPALGARLRGGCCRLSPGTAGMLARLAAGVTLAAPFVGTPRIAACSEKRHRKLSLIWATSGSPWQRGVVAGGSFYQLTRFANTAARAAELPGSRRTTARRARAGRH